STVNNFFVLWSVRDSLSFRRIYPLLIGAAFGIPVGVYLLKALDAVLIKRGLGAVLILFSSYSLLKRGEAGIKIGRVWALPAGVVSGVLNGLINMGGPPVIIYTYHKGWDKRSVKAALTLYFTVMSLYKIPVLTGMGLVTWRAVKLMLLLIPIIFAGALIGFTLFERVNRETMRRITYSLLLGLGITLLFR
ncbi:hypothetical protein DRP77_09745, partial [Candidatus Poribacteria bacterium]